MDMLTLVGLLLAIVAIFGGNYLDGGSASALLHLTPFLIVVGGTFGAVLVQTPLDVFKRAMALSAWVFIPPVRDYASVSKKIILWSKRSKREGLLAMQNLAKKEKDPFVKKALMLVADGLEPQEIRKALIVEIDMSASRDADAAKVFEGMGGYAPTIGIIGAVLGLIQVMNNLSEPALLGPGIATAFVATIYGVGSANFIFLPMAAKIRTIVEDAAHYREMVVDGLVSIADGESTGKLESKLSGYSAK